MFFYICHILGWTALLARAGTMQEHREERSQDADQQSRTHLVQIPWSMGAVCSLSRNKGEGDVSILKATSYTICWSDHLFISHYPQGTCAVSKRLVHHCRNTLVHAADTCCRFPPQPSRLYFAMASNVALPSQRLCQMQVTFLNPQGQWNREEKRHQMPSRFLNVAFIWCDNTLEGKGSEPTASWGAFACCIRDRLGQGPHHFTTTHPVEASINFCVLAHRITLKTRQNKHHIHMPRNTNK